MISKRAVKAYFKRELRSLEYIKKCSHEELDEIARELNPRPRLWKKLDLHQKACFLIGLAYPRWLFFMDMGTGKTFLTYALVDYFLQIGTIKRMLVLVPTLNNVYSWEDEAKIHCPDMNVFLLLGSTEQKWAIIRENEEDGVFVTTYQGFASMLATKAHGKKGKWKMNPQSPLFKEIQKTFQGLTLDESSFLQRKLSNWTRAARHASKYMPVRFALTGTPFGKDPAEMFTQFLVVDGGETLGQTLGLFRAAYYSEKRGFWGQYEYKFDKSREGTLSNMIQNRSIWYAAEDCIDLPTVVPRTRQVFMPPETIPYYKEQIKILRERSDYHETKNAFLMMRQIASGFIGVKDDETGEKAKIAFPKNPKLDELMQLLEEIPPKRKIIVFHEYIYTGDLISAALTKAKIKHARLWGGQKDKRGEQQKFKNDKSCRVLVVNNTMGAYGLNLQVANYIAVFESPVDPKVRKQMKKRIERRGQKAKKVFIVDLVMARSVDVRILEAIAAGENLFNRIVKSRKARSQLLKMAD